MSDKSRTILIVIHDASDSIINIYGGDNQIFPNVSEIVLHLHDTDITISSEQIYCDGQVIYTASAGEDILR